jgi:polyhydroxyalkanoate synthesis regulator phasin
MSELKLKNKGENMKTVEEIIKDQVEEINEEQQRKTEREVRSLIQDIINKQSNIAILTNEIIELKAKLKKLQAPEKVQLEV